MGTKYLHESEISAELSRVTPACILASAMWSIILLATPQQGHCMRFGARAI